MRLVPPMADREGNIYILYGAPDWFETQVFVGRVDGGWTGGCSAERGTSGLHGFVGRSLDRVWYWSGSGLVEVVGETGACREVLSNDPVSGTELTFLGVAPMVDETPTRRFAYALLRGATGVPTFSMVDLDAKLPFNGTEVPAKGEDPLEVIATGAWSAVRATAFVVRVGNTVTAYFLDRGGDLVDSVELDVPRTVEAYGVPGNLQFSDGGAAAGLTADGRVLVLNLDGGGLVEPDFNVQGVLRWDGRLYLTGEDSGGLVIAEVQDDRSVDEHIPFVSASLALDGLDGPIDVIDERGSPLRTREWSEAESAIGSAPLISPWVIDPYTIGSTGWLLAGPGFDTGVEPVTATAFAPVGLELP